VWGRWSRMAVLVVFVSAGLVVAGARLIVVGA
jgi:hypothetical protein